MRIYYKYILPIDIELIEKWDVEDRKQFTIRLKAGLNRYDRRLPAVKMPGPANFIDPLHE